MSRGNRSNTMICLGCVSLVRLTVRKYVCMKTVSPASKFLKAHDPQTVQACNSFEPRKKRMASGKPRKIPMISETMR